MSIEPRQQPKVQPDVNSAIDVLKVAKLARLHVAPAEIDETRAKLGAVVSYMDRLRGLDLAGVEPLAHVGDVAGATSGGLHNRLDEDVAKPESLRGVLPMLTRHLYEDSGHVFVQVPKVSGDAGGSAAGAGAGGGA